MDGREGKFVKKRVKEVIVMDGKVFEELCVGVEKKGAAVNDPCQGLCNRNENMTEFLTSNGSEGSLWARGQGLGSRIFLATNFHFF